MNLKNEIRKAGLKILFQKYWIVSEEYIQVIHQDLSLRDPYFPYMCRNYSQFPSVFLLVEYGGHENIHKYLSRFKKEIRKSYLVTRGWKDEEILFNDVVDRSMVENRIHTPDSTEESVGIITSCFSLFEISHFPKPLIRKIISSFSRNF